MLPAGKLYWYGPEASGGSEILAETDGTGTVTTEYTFLGGKCAFRIPDVSAGRIAMLPAGGSPQYYVEDFLGSSRVVTQSNGVVCYDSDFTPFGGELAYTNACLAQNNYKFEGKERDVETGNDDFGARYYTWRFGRWLSADWSSVPVPVPYANLSNPQTLNLYAMVADDPETFADLDGHCWPAASCVAALNNALDRAVAKVQTNSLNSSPTMAAVKTSVAGATADTIKMIASPLTVGSATGACMGGNGCSAGQTALAVGGDVLKGAAIAGGLSAVAGNALSATAEATTTVTHFTNDAGVQAITDAGGVLRGGGQATGTFVTPASEIPTGATGS